MGKLKPLIDAIRDSGDSAAAHGRRLVDLPGNHKTKIDDIRNKTNDTDRAGANRADADAPGGPGGSDRTQAASPPSHPFPDPPPPFNRAHPELADRDLVDRFDATTAPDGAVFWSGRTADGGSSMDSAATYAQANDGTTLEQMLEQQGMTGDMPNDWSDPSTIATWQAVSEKLAANANGDATAVHGEVRDTSVWNSVEFPALVRNDAVRSITIVDANTGEAVMVYAR